MVLVMSAVAGVVDSIPLPWPSDPMPRKSLPDEWKDKEAPQKPAHG